jgi:hypothetical protein
VIQTPPDPAIEWAGHLQRLGRAHRDAVVASLRHSASIGWPASERGVELLIAYALGEITARGYADGIVRSWDTSLDVVDVPGEPPAPEPSAPEPPPVSSPATVAGPHWISREQAVHAYVTGEIDVGEFLCIARS